MSEPKKGRIAISLGSAKPSTSRSSRPAPASALSKRSRSDNNWGDSSDEGSDHDSGKHEAITGFGDEGVETRRKKPEAREYVIQRQGNRDWKAEAKSRKRQHGPLPDGAGDPREGRNVETEPADDDKAIAWGLTVKVKKAPSPEAPSNEASEEPAPDKNGDEPHDEPHDVQAKPARTADDEAMDRLLGRVPEKELAIIEPSQEDAFQRDMDRAGEASTLADYEAMPVEEFGAALLRGMGWNGEARGPKPKEVKRRANRLGLGAKELKDAEDLGGWDQNGKKKSSRPPRLNDYRREEAKKKDERRHADSYKSERDRERQGDRHRSRRGDDQRDYDRRRDRHRDDRPRDSDRDRYDRDRRR